MFELITDLTVFCIEFGCNGFNGGSHVSSNKYTKTKSNISAENKKVILHLFIVLTEKCINTSAFSLLIVNEKLKQLKDIR